MSRRSRRIDRKLHRWFLALGVQDASQVTSWRKLAHDGALDVEHPIDAAHCAELPRAVTRGLGRHGLRYTMARIAAAPPEAALLGFDGCMWLRFRAVRHPDVVVYAATSPPARATRTIGELFGDVRGESIVEHEDVLTPTQAEWTEP